MASPSATARSTSASSTGSSSRSTSRRAGSCGRRRWRGYQQGYTITNAPLYYNGRVYTGVSGGEFGIRGRLTAFERQNGQGGLALLHDPGPRRDRTRHVAGGQRRLEAWRCTRLADAGRRPRSSGCSTSPPGTLHRTCYGAQRAGDNLFSASIIAIDAKTGKYRWHFQEVHHDIWDYDATSPVVLFDVSVKRSARARQLPRLARRAGCTSSIERRASR